MVSQQKTGSGFGLGRVGVVETVDVGEAYIKMKYSKQQGTGGYGADYLSLRGAAGLYRSVLMTGAQLLGTLIGHQQLPVGHLSFAVAFGLRRG